MTLQLPGILPTARMRAISLTQPWCGLMAAGIKLIENRSNPIVSAKDFGVPFGLHATRVFDESVINRAIEIAPELAPRGPYSLADSRWYKLGKIASAVIAVATIERVIKAVDFEPIGDGTDGRWIYSPADLDHVPVLQRRFMFGRICYLFAPSPIVLPTPVPCRGWQGFWTMDVDTHRAVQAQLAEAAAA